MRTPRFLGILALCAPAFAGGGPLGIDHRVALDDHGIWQRKYQIALEDGVVATEILGALWNGGDTRLGRTFWQSVSTTKPQGRLREVPSRFPA